MKQARSLYLAAAIALGGAMLIASDAWESKDPSQWTSEEIDQILNKSAWAKRTEASFDGSGYGQNGRQGGGRSGGGMGIPGIGFPGGGGMGGGGMGGGGMGGGMGRGRGGMGRGGGRAIQQEPVVVRWDSALPVIEAFNRNHASSAAKPTEDSYIISVTGLRAPRHRRSSDASDGNDSEQNNEDSQQRIKDELMTNTRLLAKGRDAVTPTGVQLDSAGGTSEVRFVFSKQQPFSLDDKEIEFETRLGPEKVSVKFHPKEMKYKGKLEL